MGSNKQTSTMNKIATLLIISCLVLFVTPKSQSIGSCVSTVRCSAVNGQLPSATLVGADGTNRDSNGYWAGGQTTNALGFQEGDVLWVSYTASTNICNGTQSNVAVVSCLNFVTGQGHQITLTLPPCKKSGYFTIHTSCIPGDCTLSATGPTSTTSCSPTTYQQCQQ